MISVFSPLEVATRILSSIGYQCLDFYIVVFYHIIQNLDDFLQSSFVFSYPYLALSMKTYLSQWRENLKKHNGAWSYLSMSVDPRVKPAYVVDVTKREEIQKNLLDYIIYTYSTSISRIPRPSTRRKRAQNLYLHEFLPAVRTTRGFNETLEEEDAGWFLSPTVFLDYDNDVFTWWITNHTHFIRVIYAANNFITIHGGDFLSEGALSLTGRLVTMFCKSSSHDSI